MRSSAAQLHDAFRRPPKKVRRYSQAEGPNERDCIRRELEMMKSVTTTGAVVVPNQSPYVAQQDVVAMTGLRAKYAKRRGPHHDLINLLMEAAYEKGVVRERREKEPTRRRRRKPQR